AASLRPTNAELNFGADQVEAFRSQSGLTLSTSQPIVKAAIACLNERWPQAVAFSELVTMARSLLETKDVAVAPVGADNNSDGRTLGAALLTAFSKGLCELHTHPGSFALSAGERSQACPLVRIQAAHGDSVTNRRHERVLLDSLARRVLPLLDGT